MADESENLPVEVRRHLAAITREAAGRAYDADATTSGKITTWLMTVLTTLHAGGLYGALQYPEKLVAPHGTQTTLLVGLIVTIAGGVAGMIHYNFLAEKWRQQMHMEVEGSIKVSEGSASAGNVADIFDRIASGLLACSTIALAVAGACAI